MSALDFVLSFVGLALFAAFVGTIALYVPHVDLIIVIAVAFAMAVFDFWVRPFLKR